MENALTGEQACVRGYFDTREKGSRYMMSLAKRKRIHFAGTVLLHDQGRPAHVFTKGWFPKNLKHEVIFSDVLHSLRPHQYTRRRVDKRIRPDAEVWFENEDGELEHWYIELDNCTMSYEQLATTRFPKYRKTSDPVLWIAHGDTPKSAEIKMDGMRQRATGMQDAFFTTTHKLFADPFGPILVDENGQVGALPKPSQKP
jgi:hypothetical protein